MIVKLIFSSFILKNGQHFTSQVSELTILIFFEHEKKLSRTLYIRWQRLWVHLSISSTAVHGTGQLPNVQALRNSNLLPFSKMTFLTLCYIRYTFTRHITTFTKVRVAHVFGLQTLYFIDFTKIFQLKALKPKNKGHSNFYECCDLTKKSISNWYITSSNDIKGGKIFLSQRYILMHLSYSFIIGR